MFLLYKVLDSPRVQFQMHCHLAVEIAPISLHQIRKMEFSRHVVSASGVQVSVISKLIFQAPWWGGVWLALSISSCLLGHSAGEPSVSLHGRLLGKEAPKSSSGVEGQGKEAVA